MVESKIISTNTSSYLSWIKHRGVVIDHGGSVGPWLTACHIALSLLQPCVCRVGRGCRPGRDQLLRAVSVYERAGLGSGQQ